MRDTGEVIARGFHKFFNVGQIKETNIRELRGKVVVEVLEKLDGQMVMGVVVGDEVQWWSRRGHTMVGGCAWRVAAEIGAVGGRDYKGMVRWVTGRGCTVV